MRSRQLFLTALFFLGFADSGFARPKVIFVLDVDNFLVFTDVRKWNSMEAFAIHDELVRSDRSLYRMAHGAREFVTALSRLNVEGPWDLQQIVWSAYARKPRTEVLCKNLFPREFEIGCPPFSRIIESTMTTDLSNARWDLYLQKQPRYAIFEGKHKKDLAKLQSDYPDTEIILIDDQPSNVTAGFEKHFIWARNADPFSEMARIYGLIEMATEIAVERNIPLSEALWELQWEESGARDELRFREEVAEGVEPVLRGLHALQKSNPDFVIRPPTLAAAQRAARLSPEIGMTHPEFFSSLDAGASQLAKEHLDFLPLWEFFRNADWESDPTVYLPPPQFNVDSVVAIRGVWMVVRAGWRRSDGIREYLVSTTGNLNENYNLRVAETLEGFKVLRHYIRYARSESSEITLPEMVLAGHGFCLQRALPGTTAEQLSEQGRLHGMANTALRDFFADLIKQRIYVSGLFPADLAWDGTRWTLLRSGQVHQPYWRDDSNELALRYEERLKTRWGVNVRLRESPVARLFGGGIDCGSLVGGGAMLPTTKTVPIVTPAPTPAPPAAPKRSSPKKESKVEEKKTPGPID